ncbi:MAG TPA: hypothetical protein VIV58_21920 [Kofleriaceae bacterium]
MSLWTTSGVPASSFSSSSSEYQGFVNRSVPMMSWGATAVYHEYIFFSVIALLKPIANVASTIQIAIATPIRTNHFGAGFQVSAMTRNGSAVAGALSRMPLPSATSRSPHACVLRLSERTRTNPSSRYAAMWQSFQTTAIGETIGGNRNTAIASAAAAVG